MQALFAPQMWWLWAVLLGFVLFFPVRRLIWVMMVRRSIRLTGVEPEEDEKLRLRRRAGVTSFLLCYIFAILYTYNMFAS